LIEGLTLSSWGFAPIILTSCLKLGISLLLQKEMHIHINLIIPETNTNIYLL